MATSSKPKPENPVRYAAYDNTLARFCTGVVDTREEAEELAKNSPESHDIEIREV